MTAHRHREPDPAAPSLEPWLALFARLLPDDRTAEAWFAQFRWPDGVRCARCDGHNVYRAKHPTMPYRCRDCRRYFSVKHGTIMQASNLGYQQWALALLLMATQPAGTPCPQLERTLGVTHKTAWFLGHRLRQIWADGRRIPDASLADPEVTPAYDAQGRLRLRPLVQAKAQVYGPASFWSLMNQAYQATYRHISPKHLQRYIQEFAGRQQEPDPPSADQLARMVRGLQGKRLSYQALIEPLPPASEA